MDNILIYAVSIKDLTERTLHVLDTMEKNDLFLKPEKCEFEKTKVEYLRYLISYNKIKMDPKKLAGISDWPVPKNLWQVWLFLGFGNFYWQFIEQFSHTVWPLTALTKKDKPFAWTAKCEQAFQGLKKWFLEQPILVMLDQDQLFYLETDASAFASGGVLMQKDGNRHLHPCGYISWTFTETEQKYDRELLALIRALNEWKVYLEGAKHIVTVYIDHDNLRYFCTGQTLNKWQAQWSLYLLQFSLQRRSPTWNPMLGLISDLREDQGTILAAALILKWHHTSSGPSFCPPWISCSVSTRFNSNLVLYIYLVHLINAFQVFF